MKDWLENFWYDMGESIIAVGIVLGLVILVLTLFFGGWAINANNKCEVYKSLSPDYEYHYSFWTGCLVKTPDGMWINVDEWKKLEINGK